MIRVPHRALVPLALALLVWACGEDHPAGPGPEPGIAPAHVDGSGNGKGSQGNGYGLTNGNRPSGGNALANGSGSSSKDGFQAVVAQGGHSLGRFVAGAPPTPEIATASIGPEGGSLALGDWEIVVPPGAVSSNTLFMIRRPVDAHSREYALVELRPHDTPFLVPVVLRMPLDGTTAAGEVSATLASWDDAAGGWADAASRVIEGGARLEAAVTHFSYWGTKFDRGELSSGGR